MRKILALLTLGIVLVACGSQETATSPKDSTLVVDSVVTVDSPVLKVDTTSVQPTENK